MNTKPPLPKRVLHSCRFNCLTLAAAILIAGSQLSAQTALPIGENLPFAFAGRSVPQLFNGTNGFRFTLPANTVYAAVRLQAITASTDIQLLVRRGQDIAGTAAQPVSDDRDVSTRRNKRVQVGYDSQLPIASDQPYFVALRASESTDTIAGTLSLDVQTLSPGGTVVEFSGIADLRLAGQPDGVSIGNGALAPLNSPPPPIAVTGGQGIRFQSVGNSTESWSGRPTGPEGEGYDPNSDIGVFGLSAFQGPPGGVVGVFLGPTVNAGLAGQILPVQFASDTRERLVLRPRIQQVFFIGSGLNSDGLAKTFVAPAGATRLYLGRARTVPTGTGHTTVRVEVIGASAVPPVAPANPLRLSATTRIFLAGAPDNTQSGSNASAPVHTPPQVAVNLVPGQALIFRASGSVSDGCSGRFHGPSGADGDQTCSVPAERDISGFNAKAGALIGVFLGQASAPRPDGIDYTGGVASVSTLRPLLQQVFLIGDGRTADGSDRRVIVPTGATRLFISHAGGDENQVGSFTVSVSAETPGRPAYSKASVVNGASFSEGAVSVGSIVSIFGQNLGKESSAGAVPLPKSLGGTQVYFDSIPAPLYFVTPGQINAQVPWELGAVTSALLTIVRDGAAGTAVEVDLAGYQPGLFSAATIGAILVNSRTGALVSPQAPARAGDVLVGYATGLGLTAAHPLTGEIDPGSPLATAALTTKVVLTGPSGEKEATPFYAGLAPGFVGVFQINFEVPSGLGTGTVRVRLQSVPFGASNTAEFALAP